MTTSSERTIGSSASGGSGGSRCGLSMVRASLYSSGLHQFVQHQPPYMSQQVRALDLVASEPMLRTGDTAPDFALLDQHGNVVSLADGVARQVWQIVYF